jgi:hypothetical protein
MATSANVSNLSITKDGKEVGKYRHHAYCKFDWATISETYQPIDDYEIVVSGLDEEEVYWENESQPLKGFLSIYYPEHLRKRDR